LGGGAIGFATVANFRNNYCDMSGRGAIGLGYCRSDELDTFGVGILGDRGIGEFFLHAPSQWILSGHASTSLHPPTCSISIRY